MAKIMAIMAKNKVPFYAKIAFWRAALAQGLSLEKINEIQKIPGSRTSPGIQQALVFKKTAIYSQKNWQTPPENDEHNIGPQLKPFSFFFCRVDGRGRRLRRVR
jgi:hypothetical protein